MIENETRVQHGNPQQPPSSVPDLQLAALPLSTAACRSSPERVGKQWLQAPARSSTTISLRFGTDLSRLGNSRPGVSTCDTGYRG